MKIEFIKLIKKINLDSCLYDNVYPYALYINVYILFVTYVFMNDLINNILWICVIQTKELRIEIDKTMSGTFLNISSIVKKNTFRFVISRSKFIVVSKRLIYEKSHFFHNSCWRSIKLCSYVQHITYHFFNETYFHTFRF